MREVVIPHNNIVGRGVMYNGCKVGHVVRVEGNTIICAIDEYPARQMRHDMAFSLELEVVDNEKVR